MRHPWPAIAALCLAAAVGAPSGEARAAEAAGTVFTLARVTGGAREVLAIEPLPDGGFVALARTYGMWSIQRWSPDGSMVVLGRGFGPGPVPGDLSTPGRLDSWPDGGLIVPDAANNRIVRWEAGSPPTQIGPAFMSTPAVEVGPDRSILVVESFPPRVLLLRPDGTLATVASGLGMPLDAARDADGGVLIADALRGGVQRAAADGTVSSVAGGGEADPAAGLPATRADLGYATSVAGLRGGGFLASAGMQVIRVRRDGVIARVWGDPQPPSMMMLPSSSLVAVGDGGPAETARFFLPAEAVESADGGTLIGEADRIRYVAPRAPALLAVAASPEATASRRGFRTSYRATRRADVRWQLRMGSRVVASGASESPRRTGPIRVARAFRRGVYVLSLTATEGGRTATSAVRVFLGGRLTEHWAERATDTLPSSFEPDDDEMRHIERRWLGCRRFALRRIDCAEAVLADGELILTRVASVRLGRDGQMVVRTYPSSSRRPSRVFRRRPFALSDPQPVDLGALSRRVTSAWSSGPRRPQTPLR